jgi:hypothetical protein
MSETTVDARSAAASEEERRTLAKLGRVMIVTGAVAQAAGLGVDVIKHLNDPGLAAREALLTFDNVGHVLLIGGIALVVAGVGVMLLGPLLAKAGTPIRVGVPLVCALVVGGASLAAANSSLARGHEHGPVTAGVAEAAEPSHGHGGGEEHSYEPLDRKTRDRVSAELTQAREVALSYPTVDDAKRAGYRAVTPYLPLIGAHYMRFVTVDGTFDIEQPEMLLYDEDNEIVGLSYYVRDETTPEGFAGPNDHWHRHIGLCVDASNPFVLGDEQTTEEECRRRGGVKAEGADGWMVHAWVVPGWDSPQGVFSAENAQLQ